MRLNSYPSVFQLGHPQVKDLFEDDVIVEEKVDGSQISFGVIDSVLHIRSKKAEIVGDPGMFAQGVETITRLQPLLVDGWQYRGEYLRVPHHNALTYDRVPKDHIILFDVMTGYETYESRDSKEAIARNLGLEIVPILYQGRVESMDRLQDFLSRDSVLSGCKIEGVVIKNYSRFGPDKKFLCGKYVRPEFKELNSATWSGNNPSKKDILSRLIEGLRTEARWDKAIQHLRDAGELENSPKDIGKLLIEVQNDVEKECKEEILEALWKDAWPQIKRGVISRFPEHYKERLAEGMFDGKTNNP